MSSTRLDRVPHPHGSPPPESQPGVPLGRLRAATTAMFVLSGFVFGSWAARLPDISHQVGATPTSLGIALLSLSLGALAAMPLAGALSARLGAGLVSAGAAVLLCATAVLPALAGSVTTLGAVLLVFGAATGMLNVASNSLGVHVEARAGSTVLPYLHAGFSFGGLGGALVGGLVGSAAPDVGAAAHLLAVGTAGLLLTAAVAPTLARSHCPSAVAGGDTGDTGVGAMEPTPARATTDTSRDARSRATSRTPLVLLGAMAGSTAFAEGALTDWGALHLRETLLATPAVAAAGYAGFSLAMGAARLGGGRLVDRLGDTRLLVCGALLAAVGMLAAALSPALPVALAGFVLVGLGLANVFPLAIARAGARGGAEGVALASTVGYGGLLVGPPLIGFLAEAAGLRVALSTISVLAVAAAVLAVRTDAHASPAALRVWPGAASLGPGLVRAVAVKGGPPARRHGADLNLLIAGVPTGPPRVRVSDAELLFG